MSRWLSLSRISLALAIFVTVPRLAAQVIPPGVYTTVINGDTISTGTVYADPGSSFSSSTLAIGNSAGIYWRQVGSLNNLAITFGSGAYVYVTGVNHTLTLGSNFTATGNVRIYSDGSSGTAIDNQGTLTNTTGTGLLYAITMTNSGAITATGGTFTFGNNSASYSSTNTGTVTADGSGTYVYLAGAVDNNGTMTAQNNGILDWYGNTTTANLGNVVLTGGCRAFLEGTVDNTSANLVAPTGGAYQLMGGTILGGTIDNNALTFSPNGGYLNGATLSGDLSLSGNSTYVRFLNGATFTGANANLAANTGIYWQQSATLTGKNVTQGVNSYIYLSGVGTSLTLDPATTVSGNVRLYTDGSASTTILNQGTLNNTSSTGQVYAVNFTNSGSITNSGGASMYLGSSSAGYNSTNTGTITSDGVATATYVRGNFDNNGTMTAQNSGILYWEGNSTTANLGNVVLAGGGRALLTGSLDNSATNLVAPTGGSFELYGGTVTGGTIDNNALTFTSNGGYLDGATLTGDLSLNGTYTYVRFINGATFTGANANLASNTGVYWQQAGTLSGKAITLGTSAYIYLAGIGAGLTLDPTTTVTGNVRIYSDGSAGTSFTNQGTLTNTISNGQIYAANFTNAGAITSTNGYIYLGTNSGGYNATNTGTVTADGGSSSVYLQGNFLNNGTITAQNSGTLIWNGNIPTASLGSVVLASGGQALLNGTINNTSANLVAPTGGSYQLYGGTITGGTIDNNALTFTSSGGYLNGATLTGDLNLNGSSAYVRFTNGGGFSGANANLANGTGLYWQQVGTLLAKTLALGTNSYLYLAGTGVGLTLDAATTATGNVRIYTDGSAGTTILNQGTLTNNAGTGQIYASNFTNEGAIAVTTGTTYLGYPAAGFNTTNTGTVTSDGGSTTVYLRGNVDNNGTVTAQNGGTLLWDGNNTTANLGNVVLTGGGRALLNGVLDNTATNLVAPTGGSYQLYGGTITGGTIDNDALAFTPSGGYLSGASLTGDLNVGTSGAYVRFINGASFTGANASLATNAGVYWQQNGTLAGKAVTLNNGAYFYVTGANNSLTFDAATTVTGTVNLYTDGSTGAAITNQGTLNHTGGSGSNYAASFTNAGTILATGGTMYLGYPSASYNTFNSGTVTSDNATVYLRGNFANTGTVTAQNNGILVWDGTNTTGNLGNVVLASGGRARLVGTITNAGTLTAPTGGTYDLYGGTITGGTVAANTLSYTSSGGYLDGLTLADDLNLSAASSYVRFINGTVFTGTNATFSANSGLYWQQTGTLAGKTISMAPGSIFYVIGANNSLTLDAATTATGTVSLYSDGSAGATVINQGTINHTGGSGYNYAANYTNAGTILATGGTFLLGYPSISYNTTNTGTVTSDGAGTTVYLRGNLANTGTVTAQNGGVLLYDGTNTTANLGNVVLAGGGHAKLNGTIDNTAATLTAPTGGSFELYGGTIQGGTIGPGALTFTTSGGYLYGVTVNDDLNLAAGSAYVRFTSGTSFTGTNASFANNTSLYWQQMGTLVDKLITMATNSSIYVQGVGNQITFDPGTVLNGSVAVYSDSSTGSAITNQGTINHTGGAGYFYAPTATNSGTLNVSSGNFYLGEYSNHTTVNTATGVINQTGGTLTLYAPLTNLGTLNVTSGTLYANGYLTNGLTGRIGGSGTIYGDLNLGAGTIAPGNSIGTLTINASDFVVSGPSVFEVELDATSSDRLTFANPTSNVDIGAGLLTLSLNLLSAPGTGTTYTLMNISSGSFAITGTFAGLPNSGDALIATFAGTDYTFNVGYLGNSIILSVPEPSTYALLGAGLALLALRRRRRA